MAEEKVVVSNEMGLHARPAAAFVKLVKNFPGKVEIIKDGKVANAKSIFNVMSLGVASGTEITIRVTGEDEEENLKKVVDFIKNLED